MRQLLEKPQGKIGLGIAIVALIATKLIARRGALVEKFAALVPAGGTKLNCAVPSDPVVTAGSTTTAGSWPSTRSLKYFLVWSRSSLIAGLTMKSGSPVILQNVRVISPTEMA